MGCANGAFVGKSCVAILRPSANRSCKASAAAMIRCLVLGLSLGVEYKSLGQVCVVWCGGFLGFVVWWRYVGS